MDIGSLWRWWTGELISLIPKRVRGALSPSSAMVAIRQEENGLFVGRRDRSDAAPVTIDTAGLDKSTTRVAAQQAVSSLRRGGEPVAILLRPSEVIRAKVQLPEAAAENLREVLGYDMDGRTPFTADEVYYDYRVVDRDSDRGRISVDLAVAPRATVDAAAEEAESWGLSPVTIALAEAWESPERDFIFRSDRDTGNGSRASAFVLAVLILGAVTLAAVWGNLYVENLRSQAAMLSDTVASLKKEASAAIKLRGEIDALSRQRSFSLNKKREQSSVIVTLNRLTDLIPEDSWLIQFQFKGNQVQIQGYSPDASNLVQLIESAPHFRNATFRSRVTRDARSGAQRFHIAFDVVPES